MKIKLLIGLGFKFGFVPFFHFPALWLVTRSLAGPSLLESGEDAEEWGRRKNERHAKSWRVAVPLPSFLPVFFFVVVRASVESTISERRTGYPFLLSHFSNISVAELKLLEW